MRALIFADRLGRELEPLTERTCVALLPVVGKRVLEHTLETLVAAGVRDAVVAISPFADQVRAVIGDGSRWGMRLDYVLTQGEEDPGIVVERYQNRISAEVLALRGDVLHGVALGEFLRRAGEIDGPVVLGRTVDAPVSLCLNRATGRNGLEPLRWTSEPSAPGPAWPVVELPTGALNRLDSLAAYHRANLDAAAGRFPELIVPGRQVALGLTVGPRSRVSPHSLRQGIAFVGSRCRIESNAEFYGEVVIADDVIVDRHAILRDSVVLPDTYIGELVDVQYAIGGCPIRHRSRQLLDPGGYRRGVIGGRDLPVGRFARGDPEWNPGRTAQPSTGCANAGALVAAVAPGADRCAGR